MFKKISTTSINENTFKLIGEEWMLISAGKDSNYNTMTASWGGLGILWNKPVVYIFIRPQRFKFEFIENNTYFSLSFLESKHKDILTFCGTKSGRNVDKIKETGLRPAYTENGTIYFEQAKLVLECKKLYYNDIQPENFIEQAIDKNYPQKDYHRMYIGEIVSVLSK